MSQGSENSDYEDDEMCDDENYYDYTHDYMETETDKKKDDPEYFEFDLLKVEDVDRLLNESVEALCKSIQVCELSFSTCFQLFPSGQINWKEE